MKTITMKRDEAIKALGSYLEVTTDWKSIVRKLGTYEANARNAGYRLNPGQHLNDAEFYPWYFRDNPAGIQAAVEYAHEKLLKSVGEKDEEIARREQIENSPLHSVRSYFSESFREDVAAYKAKTAKMKRERADSTFAETVELPDMVTVNEYLPVGTPLYVLDTNHNDINIREFVIDSLRVYDFARGEGMDASVSMYYREVGVDDDYQGSLSENAICDDGEIVSHIHGCRVFLNHEDAVAAGKEFAKEMIKKMKLFQKTA